MRMLLALVAMLMSVLPALAQELASQELQGRVRSVLIETTMFQNGPGRLPESKAAPRLMRFDAGGFLVEDTVYSEDGIVQEQTLFVRDGARMPDVYRYGPGQVLRSHEVRTFDESGAVLSTVSYGPAGEVLFRSEDRQDTYYKPDGTVDQVLQRHNEEAGKTEILRLREGNALEQRIEIESDAEGQLRQTIYNGDGAPTSDAREVRRNGNRFRKETNYDKDGKTSTSSYMFDQAGRLIGVTLQSGSTYRRMVSTHDEQGRLTSTSAFDRDSALQEKTTFEYEYDESGNWIRRTEFRWTTGMSEPRLQSVTTRTITYD